MPSASTKVPTTTQDNMKLPVVDLTEPFKQVVTLIEHKIRNMEKRKLKLDGYKQEQEQGKDLNADQLLAVSKYGELMQSLDFARDISKQVTQIQAETSRLIKKQNRREQTERIHADAERTKEIMILTNWLNRLVMLPEVRADFVNGTNPSHVIFSTDENSALDELAGINGANFDVSCELTAGIANEHFSNLIEGKDKTIPKTSLTYSHMKKLLLSLNSVPYAYQPSKSSKYQPNKSDSGDADVSADSDDISAVPAGDSAQLPNETGNYNYVQNLIESPDMDPAVVVTSTNAPPQLMTQQLATMHQVIPQTSHSNFDHRDSQGQEETPSGEGYNNGGSSATDLDMTHGQCHGQMQSQEGSVMIRMETAPAELQQNQHHDWENKTVNYEGYGANSGGEGMERNDFMENNFSTWEGTQGGEGQTGGNNRGGNFRRGGGGRYQNSNGHNRGGNRYGQGDRSSGNRWASQGDRGGYDDYRGGRGEHRGENRAEGGDYKPRGMRGSRGGGGNGVEGRGAGGERNYYNSSYRNGGTGGSRGNGGNTSSGGGGGRRPYRGGSGYGNSSSQEQAPPSGAY